MEKDLGALGVPNKAEAARRVNGLNGAVHDGISLLVWAGSPAIHGRPEADLSVLSQQVHPELSPNDAPAGMTDTTAQRFSGSTTGDSKACARTSGSCAVLWTVAVRPPPSSRWWGGQM